MDGGRDGDGLAPYGGVHMWWPYRENIYSRAGEGRGLARSLRIKTHTHDRQGSCENLRHLTLGETRNAENRTGFSRVSSFRLVPSLPFLSLITVRRTCGRSSFKWQSDDRDRRSPGRRREPGSEAKHDGSHNLEFHQALCSFTVLTFRVARFPASLDCIA